MSNQYATRTKLDRHTDGEPSGVLDAIEITPPLERFIKSEHRWQIWSDVLRMRVPGGWLVTTVVHSSGTHDGGSVVMRSFKSSLPVYLLHLRSASGIRVPGARTRAQYAVAA